MTSLSPPMRSRHWLLIELKQQARELDIPDVVAELCFEYAVERVVRHAKSELRELYLATPAREHTVVSISPSKVLLITKGNDYISHFEFKYSPVEQSEANPQCAYSHRRKTIYQSIPSHHVIRFHRTERETPAKRNFGAFGSDKYQFNTPLGLFCLETESTTHLFVCDSGNGRVVKTSPDTNEWCTFQPVGLVRPIAIYVNPDGTMYVIDGSLGCVIVISPTAEIIRRFGQNKMVKPLSICRAATESGLLVADGANSLVHVFEVDGRYRGAISTNCAIGTKRAAKGVRPKNVSCTGTHVIVTEGNGSSDPLIFSA